MSEKVGDHFRENPLAHRAFAQTTVTLPSSVGGPLQAVLMLPIILQGPECKLQKIRKMRNGRTIRISFPPRGGNIFSRRSEKTDSISLIYNVNTRSTIDGMADISACQAVDLPVVRVRIPHGAQCKGNIFPHIISDPKFSLIQYGSLLRSIGGGIPINNWISTCYPFHCKSLTYWSRLAFIALSRSSEPPHNPGTRRGHLLPNFSISVPISTAMP